MTYDAVIVGGGIVGCACAYYLSFDLPRIALVEPGPIGGGATAAGMGHIVVMDDSEAQFALTKHSQDLWNELAPELTNSAEFEKRGTLWIAADREEMELVRAKRDFYAARGVETEVLNGKALAEAEPNLRDGFAGALFVPSDSIIFPMPAAAWLLERSGCVLVREKAASIKGGGVVLASGGELSCGVAVNAAGDRAEDLTPDLPCLPRKGHLVITDRYPGFVNHQLVELGYLKSAHASNEDSVAFNVQPRATGQLLIGSSRQYVGHYPEIDRGIVARMLGRACGFLPGLSDLKVIRTWTGFRAATPDKLPLIGAWHQARGVWIAAGHEGLGITTSLATGKLLADLIMNRPPTLDPRPYDPNRSVHAHSH